MGNLNPKQLQIIESFGLGQAVIAGAGCGKTTTLVAKCLALLEKNPKARFCAVSFTEKSVRDLKESLVKGFKEAGHEQSLTSGGVHHWVKTIHGLCASIIQEFPEASGLQGGERILVEDEASLLWTKSLNVLWTSSENAEISEALDRLLATYSRAQLESLFLKLRSLLAFGVERLIQKNFAREEVKDLWFVFQSIHHRYAHSKNRDGALDFNDLEVFALKALQSPKVQQYFQSRV
jgi:superfamily I DNA/RNA helicase